MNIQNKTVLVLGGWGLVGSAVCRRLMKDKPKRIIVTSLNKNEAFDAVKQLQKEYPKVGKNILFLGGEMFFTNLNLKILAEKKFYPIKKAKPIYG